LIGSSQAWITSWPGARSGASGEVLGERLARHRDAAAVEHAAREQHLHQRGDAADVVEILHRIAAARSEIGEERRPVARRLEVVDREVHTDGTRHRDQVQHRVGRAAEHHREHHRVLERRPRHDVARLEVELEQAPDRRARAPALV
jgi:hypothetical protein